MGSGIAETAARSGMSAIVFDPNAAVLEKARHSTEQNLAKLVEKQKISEAEKQQTLSMLSYTGDPQQLKADLVIEAIVEKLEVKRELFIGLARINSNATIMASNTSSLSINDIARDMPAPQRFCGMHFFNPAQLMKLVELVRGEHTDDATMKTIRDVALRMGKTPVECRDSPGFIVNRVARHYYLEALRLVEEGVVDIEQADRLLENAGFRMGPFRLMDLIGNDVNFAVTSSLYEACGRPLRFKPSPLQEEKLRKGELGRKTGKGYYTYG
jgi:3-hydroxybutyryl-CoA dehydrogenase